MNIQPCIIKHNTRTKCPQIIFLIFIANKKETGGNILGVWCSVKHMF